MWDLPRPGLEPMSPALAGGFLTTAPGNPQDFFFKTDTTLLQISKSGFPNKNDLSAALPGFVLLLTPISTKFH